MARFFSFVFHGQSFLSFFAVGVCLFVRVLVCLKRKEEDVDGSCRRSEEEALEGGWRPSVCALRHLRLWRADDPEPTLASISVATDVVEPVCDRLGVAALGSDPMASAKRKSSRAHLSHADVLFAIVGSLSSTLFGTQSFLGFTGLSRFHKSLSLS